jgi:predicted transcriptional regulator
MNRLDRIAPLIDALPDDVFEDFVAAAEHAAGGATVYSKLSEAGRAEIDAALARLDSGQGVAYETVKARIAAKLKTAGG